MQFSKKKLRNFVNEAFCQIPICLPVTKFIFHFKYNFVSEACYVIIAKLRLADGADTMYLKMSYSPLDETGL